MSSNPALALFRVYLRETFTESSFKEAEISDKKSSNDAGIEFIPQLLQFLVFFA